MHLTSFMLNSKNVSFSTYIGINTLIWDILFVESYKLLVQSTLCWQEWNHFITYIGKIQWTKGQSEYILFKALNSAMLFPLTLFFYTDDY
jgi:hypothetical protein